MLSKEDFTTAIFSRNLDHKRTEVAINDAIEFSAANYATHDFIGFRTKSGQVYSGRRFWKPYQGISELALMNGYTIVTGPTKYRNVM